MKIKKIILAETKHRKAQLFLGQLRAVGIEGVLVRTQIRLSKVLREGAIDAVIVGNFPTGDERDGYLKVPGFLRRMFDYKGKIIRFGGGIDHMLLMLGYVPGFNGTEEGGKALVEYLSAQNSISTLQSNL